MKLSKKQIRNIFSIGIGIGILLIIIQIFRPVIKTNQDKWRTHFDNNARNVLNQNNINYKRKFRKRTAELIGLSNNYRNDVYIKFELSDNRLNYNFSNQAARTPGMDEYQTILEPELISRYIILDKNHLQNYIAQVYAKLDAEGIPRSNFTHFQFELLQDDRTDKVKFINFAIVNNRIHSSIEAYNYNSICPTVCPF